MGSLVFAPLPALGLVQFPAGLPNLRSRKAWLLTLAGPWFPSIRIVHTVGQGPMFADYRKKLCLKGKREPLLLPEGGGRKPRGRGPNWNSVFHFSRWLWSGEEGVFHAWEAFMDQRRGITPLPLWAAHSLPGQTITTFWGCGSGWNVPDRALHGS